MYHELGLTTKEIYADLKAAGWDKSLTTLKRHQTELRKEGLIPQHYNARIQNAPKSEREPVENFTVRITPVTTTTTDDSNPVQDTAILEPRILDQDVDEDSQEWESVVSMGTEADRDYAKCLELFERIQRLTGKYITGGWTEQQWHSLGGECRTLEDGCNIHSANLREAIERDVRGFSDAFNAARAQSICQGSSNTGSQFCL
jgi:hypothetical protein